VCVDPPDAYSRKPPLRDEVQNLVMTCRFDSRQTCEVGQYARSVAQTTAGEFTDHKRMDEN